MAVIDFSKCVFLPKLPILQLSFRRIYGLSTQTWQRTIKKENSISRDISIDQEEEAEKKWRQRERERDREK